MFQSIFGAAFAREALAAARVVRLQCRLDDRAFACHVRFDRVVAEVGGDKRTFARSQIHLIPAASQNAHRGVDSREQMEARVVQRAVPPRCGEPQIRDPGLRLFVSAVLYLW